MEQVGPTEDPESYVKRQVDGLREAGVGHVLVTTERVGLSGGLEGLIAEQVVLGPDEDMVRQMQLVTIKGGIAHTLILSDLDGKPFDSARAEFRKILESFT